MEYINTRRDNEVITEMADIFLFSTESELIIYAVQKHSHIHTQIAITPTVSQIYSIVYWGLNPVKVP